MWDFQVAMIELAMRAQSLEAMPTFPLPSRYSWRFYQGEADILHWARIETSAEEFEKPEQGVAAFHRYYQDEAELKRRMIFLTDGGVPFATATAWFGEGKEGRLHWVSVDRAHQGQGLSLPLVSLAMHRIHELGHTSAYLTTQTASWVAIKVYAKFGFRPAPLTARDREGWAIVAEKTGLPLNVN